MGDVLISLGSNLDYREENIRYALDRMTAFFRIVDLSFFYETEPLDYIWQGWFINAVVSGYFDDDPLELLRLLIDVESQMGRAQKYDKGPRIIDLDILIFNNIIANTAELTIPHTRMIERKFILLPIKDIKPDFIHPTLNKHIDILINECRDNSTIIRRGHLWRKDERIKSHEHIDLESI